MLIFSTRQKSISQHQRDHSRSRRISKQKVRAAASQVPTQQCTRIPGNGDLRMTSALDI